MKTTKIVSFTLKHETIELLDKMVKEKSINKSAFIDRLINQEIKKENETK